MDTLHTQASVHEREEEAAWTREEVVVVFGVYLILVDIALVDIIYTKEVAGFSPLWFLRRNLCVLFVLLCSSFF